MNKQTEKKNKYNIFYPYFNIKDNKILCKIL